MRAVAGRLGGFGPLLVKVMVCLVSWDIWCCGRFSDVGRLVSWDV